MRFPFFHRQTPAPPPDPPEASPVEKAKADLEKAYRLFNYATDFQIIDEAIHLIRAGEIHLDNLLHQPADKT